MDTAVIKATTVPVPRDIVVTMTLEEAKQIVRVMRVLAVPASVWGLPYGADHWLEEKAALATFRQLHNALSDVDQR